MNLIISASLSEPPTETLMLRYITSIVHDELEADCLFETEKELIDLYYKFVRRQGLMDYISQFVTPRELVRGLRLSEEPLIKPVITVKAIHSENIRGLLGSIKTWIC